MMNVIKDAAKLPLKRLIRSGIDINAANKELIGPITNSDFNTVLAQTKSSVNQGSLSLFKSWNEE